MFPPFVLVVYESLSCPQSENMDLKIIQSFLEIVQICRRCWKTSSGQRTAQDKQGTREQLSQNLKTLWIIQEMTHSIKGKHHSFSIFQYVLPST